MRHAWVGGVILALLWVAVEFRPWQVWDRARGVVSGVVNDQAATSTAKPQANEQAASPVRPSSNAAQGAADTPLDPTAAPKSASLELGPNNRPIPEGMPGIAGPALANERPDGAPRARMSLSTTSVMRAQISPKIFTTVAAELPAKLAKLPVHEGQAFRKGQVLAQFECSQQQAQLHKSQVNLEIAQRQEQTQRQLFELLSTSKNEFDNAVSELMRAQADVQELQALVQKCTILAPFDGRVAEQRAREQQFVQLGQPLLEILDTQQLEVEFIATSRHLPALSVGQRFTVQVDETRRRYQARVTRQAAQIDPVSQTLKIGGVIEGMHAELKPGMSGDVQLLAAPGGDSP